jgi:hypothetical protein
MYGMTCAIIGPEDNYFLTVSVACFLVAVAFPIRNLPAILHFLLPIRLLQRRHSISSHHIPFAQYVIRQNVVTG